jgi:hypothetical protein
MNRSIFTILSFLIVLLLTAVVCTEVAAENRRYFDIGIGGGLSLNSVDSRQLLIAPALNIPFRERDYLRFRLEGNIEFIDVPGKSLLGIGVSPLLRGVLPVGKEASLFLEIGPGINLLSRSKIEDRKLGGPFAFSATGGAGLEFNLGKRLVSISYRLRHLSNGHLYNANQGLNSQYVMLSVEL